MKIVLNRDTTLCIDGINSVLLEKGIEHEVPERIAKNVVSGVYGYNIGYVPLERIHKVKAIEEIETKEEPIKIEIAEVVKEEIVVENKEEEEEVIVEIKEEKKEEIAEEIIIEKKAINNAPMNKAIKSAPKNKKNRKK